MGFCNWLILDVILNGGINGTCMKIEVARICFHMLVRKASPIWYNIIYNSISKRKCDWIIYKYMHSKEGSGSSLGYQALECFSINSTYILHSHAPKVSFLYHSPLFHHFLFILTVPFNYLFSV